MPENNTDWLLVERLKSGDNSAFDLLMERYKRPVLSFLYRFIGDATESEDVAQNVFVLAYRHLLKPGFRQTDAKFSTWLFQIARNAALDCLRRRKRHPLESISAMSASGKHVPGSEHSAVEAAVAKEIGCQIAAAVAQLPEDQRTVFILSEYEALSYAEIAAIMKSSVKSVEARLYRARQFLRRQLVGLLD